jgi:hypothetical protein
MHGGARRFFFGSPSGSPWKQPLPCTHVGTWVVAHGAWAWAWAWAVAWAVAVGSALPIVPCTRCTLRTATDGVPCRSFCPNRGPSAFRAAGGERRCLSPQRGTSAQPGRALAKTILNRSATCRDRETRVKRPTTRVARALGTTPGHS